MLYIASGDGGGSNDPGNNAQDITNNLLGKMLRLDVDGDDFPSDADRNYAIPPSNPFVGITGDDEIWAYGLRNPWRCSFDRKTGDLWIGDVGQNAREEIDFQSASSTGGENYGWRLREGNIQNPAGVGGPIPPGYVGPVYDYLQPPTGSATEFQGRSVTGGYLYRGPVSALRGRYVFADYRDNQLWTFDPENPPGTVARINALYPANVGTLNSVASFGEDAAGNLYAVDIVGGEVFRFTGFAAPNDDYAAYILPLPGAETLKGFLDDLDGDGLTNGEEFAFGLNAADPGDRGEMPGASLEGDTLVIEAADVAGAIYQAKGSRNLQFWFDLTDVGSPPSHRFELPMENQPSGFARWLISPSPGDEPPAVNE